jgi:hypothetical protein
MRTIIIYFLFSNFLASAQISSGNNVYLQFQNIEGEANVDGDDACEMLKSYVIGKTTLQVVTSKEESDFTFLLSVIEKRMWPSGNRKGKIDVLDSKTDKIIFESKWRKGAVMAFYGYSSTRHAVARLVKDEILTEFKAINK